VLHPKAGYIGATPNSSILTDFSCNALPVHTFGSHAALWATFREPVGRVRLPLELNRLPRERGSLTCAQGRPSLAHISMPESGFDGARSPSSNVQAPSRGIDFTTPLDQCDRFHGLRHVGKFTLKALAAPLVNPRVARLQAQSHRRIHECT
jgi:hypothetical protein